MAISEESRHQLHSKLDEVLGPAEAATLMAHLPPVGWADVATTHDLAELERRLNMRFSEHDRRFNEIDRRFESVDRRFESVDRRFDRMDDKLEQIRRELRSNLMVSVATSAAVLGAVVAAIKL
jgi:hypothetical protein